MPGFFSLPRELRDMIYMSVLTYSLPQPRLVPDQSHPERAYMWSQINSHTPDSIQTGEYGCAYSTHVTPETCANLLACSHQVYSELAEAIERARRKRLLVAKLDCIAIDECAHWFSWLSLPVVTNRKIEPGGKRRATPAWADRILATPQRMLNLSRSAGSSPPTTSTVLENLWIDVRIYGNRTAKWSAPGSPDRTSWAICAALKRLFSDDMLMRPANHAAIHPNSSKSITIDEMVLNVVPPEAPVEEWLPEDHPLDVATYGVVHPRTVARELLDMWNIIWTGDDFKGAHYHVLLERIKRVRICIDGVTWRVRELAMELERGQAERRRIAMRSW